MTWHTSSLIIKISYLFTPVNGHKVVILWCIGK